MSKSKITAEDIVSSWANALATSATADEVPPGWLRLDEIAKMLGKSESHTFRMLTIAVREGRCQTASYRVQRGQRVIPLRHYKLK